MTIVFSRDVDGFDDAAALALEEAGVEGVSPRAMKLVAAVADTARLRATADAAVAGAVRRRWPKARFHEAERYCVAVPRLKYQARGIPTIILETQAYVVAGGRVTLATGQSYRVVLIEAVAKPESQLLPLTMLQSLSRGSHHRYIVLERDGPWITWDMPGFDKGIRLHSGLVEGISLALGGQSLNSWLRSFGAQGKTVAPYAVGYLIGLHSLAGGQEPHQAGPGITNDELVLGVMSMGFNEAEAKEMVRAAAPYLAGVSDREQALFIVLKVHGGGTGGGP